MRSIEVSNEVFAAIWKLHQPGEGSEDAILARHLSVKTRPAPVVPKTAKPTGSKSYTDSRFGVEFPEGFVVFRRYLGRDWSAEVSDGRWKMQQTDKVYRTLNDLSKAVGAKTENVWANWNHVDPATGRNTPISILRDPAKIVKRRRAA